MDHDGTDKRLSRREFLGRIAASTAAAAGAAAGIGLPLGELLGSEAAGKATMKYRTLGRTNLKVSELGLGTIKTDNPAVIRRAFDLGVNYFDTAECYQGGNSEMKLGKALVGIRDQVVVATKWHTDGSTPAAELLASLDASLNRLGMDHVDLIQIHGASTAAQVESDELWDAFSRAKQAGKVRFHGLSTHGNIPAVMRSAISSDRYDALLVVYNAMHADLAPALAKAKQANLGIIVMKALQPVHQGNKSDAFAGLPGNPYQQAIQWVLRNPGVSTVIVDMPTFGEVDEDVAAVGMRASAAEMQRFDQAVAQLSPGTCHLCGACTAQCPRGVQVADIMRYDLYSTGYGDQARARELYRALPAGCSALGCAECEACKVVCPWGVPVRAAVERTHALLA